MKVGVEKKNTLYCSDKKQIKIYLCAELKELLSWLNVKWQIIGYLIIGVISLISGRSFFAFFLFSINLKAVIRRNEENTQRKREAHDQWRFSKALKYWKGWIFPSNKQKILLLSQMPFMVQKGEDGGSAFCAREIFRMAWNWEDTGVNLHLIGYSYM